MAKVAKVGQWVRVMYDDIGAADGIVVAHETGRYSVFFPSNGTVDCSVEEDQIANTGNLLETKNSGL